ncbi:ABC-type spermidine/putrescine transport system permease subunit II [Hoeflea halophila]|uniref:Spermidine/putrescine transport system permease protein PotC n=2 Tax=Hoeflea halophila TaxID=714899 RepID=A0A286IAN6_9HYPH|nr:ABC-type spermidine/putrescine transport system permease subunit II [Hoeflea halophila]
MADPATAVASPRSAPRRRRMVRDLKAMPGFTAMAWITIVALYLPIMVLVAFSFNENRSVVLWTGFSLDWYAKALENDGIRNAAWVSVKVALFATVISTIVATMAALATTRTRKFTGQGLVYGIINQPLMIPEIVTAIATLSLFALVKKLTGLNGIGYLMMAHAAFCIPFAYMPIRARLETMTLTLEQAAADLYAPPFKVFTLVTLPLLGPGIVSGAMLAFVVSLDDVIITLLIAGPGETTLPIYILGAIRRGITPEINAVSTILVAVSVLLVMLLFFVQRRMQR